MLRARKLGVATPALFHVDIESSCICMQRVEGASVKALLHGSTLAPADTAALMTKIGKAVAALHDGGLVHGDLTTSNMMVRASDGGLVMIDFGLSYNSIIAGETLIFVFFEIIKTVSITLLTLRLACILGLTWFEDLLHLCESTYHWLQLR